MSTVHVALCGKREREREREVSGVLVFKQSLMVSIPGRAADCFQTFVHV